MQIETLKIAATLRDTLDTRQWQQVLVTLRMQVSNFTKDTNGYIQAVKSLGIKNDVELNKRIRKVQRMNANIQNLLSSI
jgi:hypothetical protein